MKQIITHDVFNISSRIKQLDNNYYIVYDTKLNRYEIHNKKYKDSLCLVVPYKNLDCRTIELVRKSQDVEKCLNDIEVNNAKINQRNKQNLLDKTTYQLNEIYNYANAKGSFDGKAYLNKWC